MRAADRNAVGVVAPHGEIVHVNQLPVKHSTGSSNEPLIEHVQAIDAGELLDHARDFAYVGEVNRSIILDSMRREHERNGGTPEDWAGYRFILASRAIDKAISEAIKAGVILDAQGEFDLVHASELASTMRPAAWAIKDILPAQGRGAIYGASTAAKGFYALNMLLPVANGEPWQGHRTKQMPVVIVNLEGAASYPNRLKAYEAKHGAIKGPVFVLNGSPFLLTDDAQIEALAAAIEATGAAGGIVLIDTLSRAGGAFDENSSEGMGAVLAGAEKLQQRVGGLVLLVHHVGKDASKGLRGHSSLFASLDCAIEINREGDLRSWRVAKSKDGEDGIGGQFRLEIVEVGVDEDGDPITSCVVRHIESAFDGVFATKIPKGGNQRIVYDKLNQLLAESLELGRGGTAASAPCIAIEAAVLACKDCLTTEPKRRSERARSAIASLVSAGLFRLEQGWLSQPTPWARS